MGKRAFDLLFSCIALAALSPLMLFTALAVKLDSKGPVLYVSLRLGRNRRPFRFYKFRTMVVDADRIGSSVFTEARDPRITRLGTLLRLLKIDELPQFWNVFKGDMSVVGPRPEVPEIVERYYTDQWDEILSVRPGVTCLVQADYFDFSHYTPEEVDPQDYYIRHQLSHKLACDLTYIRRASFALDLWILARTAYVVLILSWLRCLKRKPRPPEDTAHPPQGGAA